MKTSITPPEVVISSIEIANLTGKNHADVMRDIQSTLTEAGIDEQGFTGTYHSSQNKECPCYRLPLRECYLVITGYSVKYRLAIIDRWHGLDDGEPLGLSSALRISADMVEAGGISPPPLGEVTERLEGAQ